MAVLGSYGSNQALQGVSAPPSFGLGDLDNQLAIPHFHVGGLADYGANFLSESFRLRSARLLPHFKNSILTIEVHPVSIYSVDM